MNQCDHIIVLVDGKIKAQGSFADLQHSGVDISSYVAHSDDAAAGDEDDGGDGEGNDHGGGEVREKERGGERDSSSSRNRARTTSNGSSKSAKAAAAATAAAAVEADKKAKADERHLDSRTSRLTTLEERKLGDVTTDTYLYYLRAGGWYVNPVYFTPHSGVNLTPIFPFTPLCSP